MKNKNLLIGGAVVVGGLLFFYFRNKRSTNNGEERSIGGGNGSGAGSGSGSGSGSGAGSGSGSVAPTTTPTGTTPTGTTTPTPTGVSTAKLSNFEVNKRLLERCGVRPPSFLKNQVNNYDVCKDTFKAELRSQGLISFNGMVENNTSGLDFDGDILEIVD